MDDSFSKSKCFVPIKPFSYGLILACFVLIVTGVFAVNVAHGDFELMLVFLTFFCYMGSLLIPVMLYRKQAGWFHPLIFFALWWGGFRDVLPRLDVFANGLAYHRVASFVPNVNMNYLVAWSLILSVIGILSLYLGYMCSSDFRVPKIGFKKPQFVRVKILFIAAISTMALFMLVREAGGVGRLMVQRGIASDQRIAAEIGGHWHFMVGLLPTACLAWLAISPKVWRAPFFYGLFMAALLMVYIATGSRSTVIFPLIIAIAIWSLHNKQLPYGKGILIAIIAIFLIGILGELRDKTRGVQTVADVSLESGVIDGMKQGIETITAYKGEVDGLYGILSKVPSHVGFLWGESYLSIPAAPIPRAIWPDKPQAGGKMNATYIFNNPLNGIPPGNIGEAYWNFHLPGVVAVMFVFGMILKWFSCLYIQNRGAGWVVAIYVTTLFFLQPNSPAFYNWLQAIIPMMAFLILFQGFPSSFSMRRNYNIPLGPVCINDAGKIFRR